VIVQNTNEGIFNEISSFEGLLLQNVWLYKKLIRRL